MKIKAKLLILENKTFEKNGSTLSYTSAKVIFEGADYPVFISVKLTNDISSYALDTVHTFDLSIGAFNYKPVYKYTL